MKKIMPIFLITISLQAETAKTINEVFSQKFAQYNFPVLDIKNLNAQKLVSEYHLNDILAGKLIDNINFSTWFLGHRNDIRSLAYSPDGSRFASASGDVFIWDAYTGKKIRTLYGGIPLINWLVLQPVGSVSWNPRSNNELASAATSGITIWDVNTGRELRTLHDSLTGNIAYNPDGTMLADKVTLTGRSGQYNRTDIILWDMRTGKIIRYLNLCDIYKEIGSCAWSPDGSRLVINAYDQGVIIWDIHTNKEVHHFDAQHIFRVAWSPDGRQIAGAARDALLIWDVQTGKTIHTLTWDTTNPRQGTWSPGLAWHPYYPHIAVGTKEHGIIVWDTQSGKRVQVLEGHTGPVSALAWSPDGKRLISGSFDSTIRIWELHFLDVHELQQMTTEQAFLLLLLKLLHEKKEQLAAVLSGILEMCEVEKILSTFQSTTARQIKRYYGLDDSVSFGKKRLRRIILKSKEQVGMWLSTVAQFFKKILS